MGRVREGVEPQSVLSVPEIMVSRRSEASNSKRWKLWTTIEEHSDEARPKKLNEEEEGWSFQTPGLTDKSSLKHAIKGRIRLN